MDKIASGMASRFLNEPKAFKEILSARLFLVDLCAHILKKIIGISFKNHS